MSQIQVTTFEANTLSANVITAGQTTVNSTGMYVGGSNVVVNTSGITVSSDSGNVALVPTISTPSINIAGVSYSSLVTETVNSQIFTANGTWVKPSWATTGNELDITHLWGGGGGGNNSFAANTNGGGGGAFVFGYYKSSSLSNTADVIVGLGGSPGASGNNSIFANGATNALTAYGGGGANVSHYGGGGGWLSAGSVGVGGNPLPGSWGVDNLCDSTFGGSLSGATVSGKNVYGGGSGQRITAGGVSIYGGAGGTGTAVVGTSIYGGFGGNNTVAPTTPGGGGGGGASTMTGARGEVRVYTLRYTGP